MASTNKPVQLKSLKKMPEISQSTITLPFVQQFQDVMKYNSPHNPLNSFSLDPDLLEQLRNLSTVQKGDEEEERGNNSNNKSSHPDNNSPPDSALSSSSSLDNRVARKTSSFIDSLEDGIHDAVEDIRQNTSVHFIAKAKELLTTVRDLTLSLVIEHEEMKVRSRENSILNNSNESNNYNNNSGPSSSHDLRSLLPLAIIDEKNSTASDIAAPVVTKDQLAGQFSAMVDDLMQCINAVHGFINLKFSQMVHNTTAVAPELGDPSSPQTTAFSASTRYTIYINIYLPSMFSIIIYRSFSSLRQISLILTI